MTDTLTLKTDKAVGNARVVARKAVAGAKIATRRTGSRPGNRQEGGSYG